MKRREIKWRVVTGWKRPSLTAGASGRRVEVEIGGISRRESSHESGFEYLAVPGARVGKWALLCRWKAMTANSSKGFKPGEKVILASSGECGIIVHSWASDELGEDEDCYVAFFGTAFPPPGIAPRQIPYILRYAASSLQRAAT